MLKPGLYEQVVTKMLSESIGQVDRELLELAQLDDGDSHDALSDHLHHIIRAALARVSGRNKIHRQLDLCNQILALVSSASSDNSDLRSQSVADSAQRLLSVIEKQGTRPERPDTPISRGCLLTGTRLDPSFDSQIRKEILSASRIDVLCSFIKWSGIRTLENELRAFAERPGSRLRVITTSYLGATDVKAIDFLQSLPNTEIKVSYDTKRTRLHAKAYTFHRDTGFGTAYVGSANLSRPALTEGLEWNVKISEYESEHLWDKITAAFETYWHDPEFVPYSEAERPVLVDALKSEQHGSESDMLMPSFDLKPYPFQQEILDQLAAERYVQNRPRHLVVAATGTGKTMIAAFDYRKFSEAQTGRYPKLMFVAHRKEILQQSLLAFRAVLRDQNFGDLWVGEHQRPESLDHLFVSVQTYNSQRLWEGLPGNYYDYMVVDEFHHAAADSYHRLLSRAKPGVLLGLTATPERADGLDVLRYFDGHISSEIRLPDAINRKLLCPFQYFGVTDTVDLFGLTWQRGGYREDELDRLYTNNDARASLVISKVYDILLDVRRARGLGFCVSIAHAEYMAEKFRQASIPSEALSAQSDQTTRNNVQKRLRRREINFIFTVDLYNEGVDIPEVDTVLFLRPTESLTVFLQQLGRGLRHYEGKDFLTVLDFIGQAHKRYRFDIRYRALVEDTSHSIEDEVKHGFPHLPAGCSIQIERIARQHILANIRDALRGTKTYMVQEIADLAERLERAPSLGEFLDFYRLEPEDIYRKGVSWSRLCVQAGVIDNFGEEDEERITRGLRRIEHISSAGQIYTIQQFINPGMANPDYDTISEEERRHLAMAHFSIWGTQWKPGSIAESVGRLRKNTVLSGELMQLLDYRRTKIGTLSPTLELPFVCPLELHSLYTRDEILAGLGYWSLSKQPDMREGVLHVPELNADLFLVTLNKTESDYSPTTMYEDYAISESLFHWQSQSTTSDVSRTGQRYIKHKEQGHTILLCVREDKQKNGLSLPYYFLGPVDYVSHTGSRPVNIVWELRYPMPSVILRKAARLAVL